MRLIGVGIVFLFVSLSAFGQRNGPYSSLGGFGNVVYPGTGHAPNSALYLNNSFPVRLGNTVAGYAPHSYPANAPRVSHGNHARGVVVPYPVFIGNGYYGGYAPDPNYAVPPPDAQADMVGPNGAPSVVINQNFVPDHANPMVQEYGDQGQPQSGMKLYQSPTNPYADQQVAQVRRPAPAPDDQPTIYLLAFKDHNIVPALGFWMEGDTLHYVSVDKSMNQASLDLIDRDLSQRLNDERGVEFKLPKQ